MLKLEAGQIVGGVDTHKDLHVAVAVDHHGRLLATRSFETTARGYRALATWLASHGEVIAAGVEGTSSWGAGLSRHLAASGMRVIEVNRPDRSARRMRGKSDPLDAEAAARAVLAGTARSTPKGGTGSVEAIRILRVARRSAMKARIQTGNQIRALIDTASDGLRAEFRAATVAQACARLLRQRPRREDSIDAVTRKTLVLLAKRWTYLAAEITQLDRDLDTLVTNAAPVLVALPAIGVDTAGALLVCVGDNPDRLTSEATFAALCGVAPLQASSGRTQRHRLNRGGDREANHALWRIVLVRMRWHAPTRAYVARRTAEGLSKAEIMRCLKRYTARSIYRTLARHELVQPRAPQPRLAR
jgi:transposase